MDQAVIQYYRRLLKTGFEHAGSLENPSIFLDTVSEKIPICGSITDYLHLYINVKKGKIETIKYLCTCDPTTNVAVEILCILIQGKTAEEIKTITEDSFFKVIESRSEEISKKAKGLMELLTRGLDRLGEKQV
jgi:NifU-like protein involved in Fe-S cluster formation